MARRLIAREWLAGAAVAARLGRVVLRPSQRETVARALAALAEFGGALVADPPGSGKTIVALAVAREATDVLVIAPATLRAQWVRAAARTGVEIRFASYESISRGRATRAGDLVILDEAHHARTPATVRHRRLHALLSDARVLLLTATPIVNRRADRVALLSLFLGPRAARLTRGELARCVLQRDDPQISRPCVRRLAPLRPAVEVPGLGAALRALPAPLPLADGHEALALIRMSLALAWSSSLAALDRALARRAQRGAAILDLLEAGRTPSERALRHWIVAPDATQLALALLVADAPKDDATRRATRRAREGTGIVRAHLAAVHALRELIRPFVEADLAARAAALLRLVAAHPTRRIVVFSRFTETVVALHRALRREAGVVAITGATVRAAAGRWTRDEVLARVGPRAAQVVPAEPREIRLLLATDLLAEGVELQGIGILVHADLPWTPARLEQRRGRLTRIGSLSREVLETWIAAPGGAAALVRLGARLKRKRRRAQSGAADPRALGSLAGLLHRWAEGPAGPRLACVDGPRSCFLALVRGSGRAPLLVAGGRSTRSGRWRVSERPDRILRVARIAIGHEHRADVECLRGIAGPLRRYLARRAARVALGGSVLRTGDALARVVGRLDRILRDASPIARPPLAALAGRLHAVAVGRGARRVDARARELTSLPSDQEFVDRVRLLLGGADVAAEPSRPRRTHRLVAALVVRPAEPRAAAAPADAPPSASPGTAAPR